MILTTSTEMPPVSADIRDEINRFHPALVAVARRLTGDAECARDIVQDTYMSVLRDAQAFRGNSAIKTYLYRIVINKSIDENRRRKRWFAFSEAWGKELLPSRAPIDELIDRKRILNRVLAKIPARLRIPLILVDIDGLTYEEISETLSISVDCVRTRIFRGREKMRKELSAIGWLP